MTVAAFSSVDDINRLNIDFPNMSMTTEMKSAKIKEIKRVTLKKGRIQPEKTENKGILSNPDIPIIAQGNGGNQQIPNDYLT